jgi:hypothetical protein
MSPGRSWSSGHTLARKQATEPADALGDVVLRGTSVSTPTPSSSGQPQLLDFSAGAVGGSASTVAAADDQDTAVAQRAQLRCEIEVVVAE